MQKTLRKIEDFHKNFLKQQRLALADLAGLITRPPSAEVEYLNKNLDMISSLPRNIINEESLEDNVSVNVRDLISSFEQQSLKDYEDYQKNQYKANGISAETTDKYGFAPEESNVGRDTDQLGTIIIVFMLFPFYVPTLHLHLFPIYIFYQMSSHSIKPCKIALCICNTLGLNEF